MSEQETETSRQSLTETATGQVRWLIDPKRGLLLPLTGIWILGLDWILFSSNVLSAGLATPVVVVLGFLLGGLGTLFLQKRIAADSLSKALLKALVAGIVVGVPWPLTGSIMGGWILVAAGLKKPKRKTSGQSSDDRESKKNL